MGTFRTTFASLVAAAALATPGLRAQLQTAAVQPESPGIYPIDQLKAGQLGTVWTVFKGTVPESFTVEVAGVVKNALGPGKSLILCQMTDPRVEKMGAVAGMSGSPMYIDGKFVGALSYQVQSFETVHFAAFTPAADMAEVAKRDDAPQADATSNVAMADTSSNFTPMHPVFTLSGLSPTVAGLMQPYFRAMGLETTALGGSSNSSEEITEPAGTLKPGDAVSVALATGDITVAGTGTVSEVNGNRVVAFGHPMMSLGSIELPMCSAEIVTIIPSALESIKIANTGPIIGTITQDRLSGISGHVGGAPDLIAVDVTVNSSKSGPKLLHFKVARQEQLSPALIAAGVTQAIVGSNDAGLSNGFRLASDVTYSATQALESRTVYAGPQGFTLGLNDFVKGLAQDLQNPYQKTFPVRVAFTVEPLDQNPAVTIDRFQLSQSVARPGDTVSAQLDWRDYQGETHSESIDIPIKADWAGKKLEVVLAPGRALDELTGKPRVIGAASLRSFDAYLAAMRDDRPTDGIIVAVAETSALFTDQTESTPDLPGSLERIAAASDEARFHQHPALLSLWETHLLTGKLASATVRLPLRVED